MITIGGTELNKIFALIFTVISLLLGSGRSPVNAEYVEIGSYPQSRVSSPEIISALENQPDEWKTFGYFSGNGSEGSAVQSDFMRYADVELNGKKYRAVVFDKYRPMKTCGTHSSETYQDDNGYEPNTVYWFEYEPLKWRSVDKEKGLLMCESIIDSQPFSNTIYKIGGAYYSDRQGKNLAHDYAESSIRRWLNEDFYNTAFSDDEKEKISVNACNQQYFPRVKEHGEMTVYDKVFMLSRTEATDSEYGFSSMNTADRMRRGIATDYAECQGIHVCEIGFGHKGNSCWWMRAPGFHSKRVNKVFYDGYCSVDSYYEVTLTDIGVRPCIIYK